uniref:Uncharacterized protein n=1 Tax=Candidatus Kentrum sp. DK TaxID=2126562 RepID=A0A450TG92_9GAMM|nr:MAG: hypothetical protein BECKDK2373C_GA0170839_11447 [Candidatus Kentron sp. DK]
MNFHEKVEHSLPRHPARDWRDPEARDGMLLPINFRETAIALQSNPNIRAAVSSVAEGLHSAAEPQPNRESDSGSTWIFFAPKGLRNIDLRLRAKPATLGKTRAGNNPNGVASSFPRRFFTQPRWGCLSLIAPPRVAATRQPWARSPFGAKMASAEMLSIGPLPVFRAYPNIRAIVSSVEEELHSDYRSS